METRGARGNSRPTTSTPTSTPASTPTNRGVDEVLRRRALAVIDEVKSVIIGKDEVIAKLFLAVLAGGHVLLEDVPGVGKTTLAVALSAAMELDYRRIQFTPEVMPADVVGYSLYDRATKTTTFQPGVIPCNLLLVDEINRASSKTQSALLEAMEEGAFTVDGETHAIPKPFLVLATQNPVGSAGTQLLPESQLDRFMLRLSLGYPSVAGEAALLGSRRNANPLDSVRRVAGVDDLRAMQQNCAAVFVADELCDYIARLVTATRENPLLRLGASPRGSLALLRIAQAVAWTRGRDYIVPDDVTALLPETLGHRLLVATQNGAMGGVSGALGSASSGSGASASSTVDEILADIVARVPRPTLASV